MVAILRRAGARSEFAIGRDFITANGERSFWFFTWARWACIPFSLLGGYICFRWARELYGDWSGLLALTLWCFGPNILANGQMITPDMGATALGVTAAYAFWKWLKRPGWMLALAAGLALGLALLTKTTWIILFGLWPALWLLWQASGGRKPPDAKRSWLQGGLQLAMMFVLGIGLLNAAYTFDGTFDRLGDYPFVSDSLGGKDAPQVGGERNRFAGTWLGSIPVPLPRHYVRGIDVQKHDFESHFNSYLRGVWQKGGWWYYHLYGLTIKVPLGVWVLALLAVFLGLTAKGYAVPWRDELTVLAPAAIVLTLVSAEHGFSHHLRYVLPMFPFCFIWMSKVGLAFGRKERLPAVVTSGAVAWVVLSSLSIYPHSLSYFNEWAGGPANGSAHLVDSNIDWGQDLLFLRDWLREHPEAKPLQLAYFGAFDARVAGIEFTAPPNGSSDDERQELGPHPGWNAVSVNQLRGMAYGIPDGRGGIHWSELYNYVYFQRFQPVGHAGWSIYIYHITPEDCARVRRQMGLSPLPEPAVTTPKGG